MLKLSWRLPSLRSQDEVPGSPEDIEVTPPRASVHLKVLEGLGRLESAPVSIGKGARSKENWCGLLEAVRNGVPHQVGSHHPGFLVLGGANSDRWGNLLAPALVLSWDEGWGLGQWSQGHKAPSVPEISHSAASVVLSEGKNRPSL